MIWVPDTKPYRIQSAMGHLWPSARPGAHVTVNTAGNQWPISKVICWCHMSCFLAGDASGEEDALGSGSDDDDDDDEMTEV